MTNHTNPISGRVAWYVAARLYGDASGAAFDAGYFPEIKGVPGPQFDPTASKPESTAHFTFSAASFKDVVVQNGDMSMSISQPGDWSLYFQEIPCGDFDDPPSFAKGRKIATWRRHGLTAGMGTSHGAMTILTFDLVESETFHFKGRDYNLRDLFPQGVTQYCFAGGDAQPALPDYPKVSCFAGTAVVVG